MNTIISKIMKNKLLNGLQHNPVFEYCSGIFLNYDILYLWYKMHVHFITNLIPREGCHRNNWMQGILWLEHFLLDLHKDIFELNLILC